jgi:fibronectin type 3 domain-containing protein
VEQLESRVLLTSVVPAGWTDADIGAPAQAGSANFTAASGAWSIAGGGADIFGASDQFNFASTSVSGNATAIVKVATEQNTDPSAKVGLMMRGSSSANDVFADIVITPGSGASFQWRAVAGGTTSTTTATGIVAPQWLELIRSTSGSNTVFTGFRSANGTTWTQVGTATYASFPAAALTGLAVTAHNNTLLNTSTFSNLSLTTSPPTVATAAAANPSAPTGNTTLLSALGADLAGESNLTYTWAATGTPPAPVQFSANGTNAAKSTTATFAAAGTYSLQVIIKNSIGLTVTSSVTVQAAGATLPTGWTDNDIGAPGVAGSATFNNGNWTIAAAGADINGASDQFNFANTPQTGDTTAIVKVVTQQNTDPSAKAGLMVRGSSAPNDVFADIVITPGSGVSFQWRPTAGGPTSTSNLAAIVAPQWLKLVRSTSGTNTVFTGFTSPDGTTWTQVGTTTYASFPAAALAGLAVTSHNNAQLNTSTFTNLSLTTSPPTVASASAANPSAPTGNTTVLSVLGTDLAAESNLTYTWAATGTPPAPVQFSANGTNAAKSTTVTFAVAGTYTLQATITNAIGLSVTSSVIVHVASAGLPSGWADNDIGTPGLAGSAIFNAGNWTIAGGGADIWNSSDQFNYAAENFSGDVVVIAKVNSVSNSDGWAKAGVMIRASSAANAAFADVVVTPGNGVAFQFRTSAGSGGNNQQVTGIKAPQWVKLGRFGNSFFGFYSADGITWKQIGSNAAVTMGTTELVGLAVTAHNNTLLSTATFSNFSATANAAPTIVNAAAATPNPLQGYTTNLSVLAADDGEERNLVYTWAVSGTPPAPVTFSTNATNAAKNTTATLSLSGTYNFLVTTTDVSGLAATSSVTVVASVPPPIPIGLNPLWVGASINVSWLPSSRAQTYNVYRGTAPGGEGSTPYVSGLTGTTFVDSAVTAGQTYYYQISALDSGGLESTRSFEALALSAVPSTPIISEFMALNSKTLKDEDGDSSDWIELLNPTPVDLNLSGYHLTDKADNLTEWTLPSVTISSGGFLIVFADGKNRTDPAHPLHTNFSLSGSGEYLALVAPDGLAVLSSYNFPAQREDVAYGVGVSEAFPQFISAGAADRVLVPTDGSLGTTWTQNGFDDSGWQAGTTGVGYETETAVPTSPGFSVRMVDTQGGTDGSVSDIGRATAILNGTAIPGAFSVVFDGTVNRPQINMGDGGNYTGDLTLPNGLGGTSADNGAAGRTDYALRVSAYVVIPAGTYTVDVNSDDGFRLIIPGVTFTNRVGENFTGATNPSPANTLVYGGARGASDTLASFTIPAGGLTTTLTVDYFEHTGGDEQELAIANGPVTAFTAGTFSLLANGVLGWQVLDPNGPYTPNYAGLIGTNTQSQMFNTGKNAAYIRVPFTVPNPATATAVRLQMKYDDGFVAYVNGQLVAQRNAPASPAWNSSASATHPDAAALLFETINIPSADLVAGTNVLAIEGLNAAGDQSDFLIYPIMDNLIVSLGAQGFLNPTPGAVNGQAIAQGVADEPTFDHPHGFYNAPFQLAISTTTPNGQIRYTLDGSAPTATNGILYTGPITVSGETDIRAATFAPGDLPSFANTASYIFLNDVLQQSTDGQPPAGWPSDWGHSVEHYGMDPRVVNDPAYSPEIKQDLLSIPTFSLSMNLADLFDPLTGIYSNAQYSGDAWERPGSIEMMKPDGSGGFQANIGVRIHGGYSTVAMDAKHGFRIMFGNQYGQSELDYPLFGAQAAQSFTEFDLRTDQNGSWQYSNPSQFVGIRDEFGSTTMAATGQPAEHTFLCFLYVDGVFWGLYAAMERPDADYAASYFGGTAADYDVVKSGGYDTNWTLEATDGTMSAWTQLYNYMSTLNMSNNANYEMIQGNNPDGTRNPNYPDLLDVDNMIDYMLVIYYTGNRDAPNSDFLSNLRPNNFYAIRPIDGSFGFRFVPTDSEWIMLDVNQNRVNTAVTPTLSTSNPAWFFQQLEPNPIFRMRVADLIQKQFFDNGPLSVPNATARFTSWMNIVRGPTVPESARWGDVLRPTQPYTRNVEWQNEINRILTSYLPQRTNIVLAQLAAVGLGSTVGAPTFNQFGGTVPSGFLLSIANPNAAGTIYYTLDGSDPMLLGGGLSATALVYSGAITMNQTTEVKARVLSGGVWSALEDATFNLSASTIRLTELNYDPPKPPTGSPYNNDDFEFVELKNYGSVPVNLKNLAFTDGINFTFDNVTLAAGQVGVLVNKQAAFISRYGTAPLIIGSYETTGQNFNNSGEHVRLVDASGQPLADFTYASTWFASTHGGGATLEVISPNGSADLNLAASWRASALSNGTPGVDDSVPTVAPAGASATGAVGQVTVNWAAVAGATSYSVYRGAVPGGELATPIATGLTANTFTDFGLTNGQTQFYFITASDFGGESAHSAEVWATPGNQITLAGAVISLAIGPDSAHLKATVDGVVSTYLLNQTGTITVSGTGSGTSLSLEESGGIVPSVRYLGGTGTSTLNVIGTSGNDSVVLNDASLTFGASVTSLTGAMNVSYTDSGGNDGIWVLGADPLTLAMGDGSDVLNVAAGSNATVNFGASDGDLTINGNGNTLLVLGTGNPNFDFSAAMAALPSPGGTIAGRVFNDANVNGRAESGEAGLANRRVFIDANHNGKLDRGERSTLTADDGSYEFTGLSAGAYTVREAPLAGWRATTPPSLTVKLVSGQTIGNHNFGQTNKSRIDGVVFNDRNNNGHRDPGDGGLAGRVVYLDTNNNGKLDAGERSTITNAAGGFSFDALAAASYVVRDVAPIGWQLGKSHASALVTLKSGTTGNSIVLSQTAKGK